MNNEIQLKLAKILELLTDAAQVGGNFILEQAPQLAKEIIHYQMWSSALSVILSPVCFFFCWKNYTFFSKKYSNTGDGSTFFFVFLCMAGVCISGPIFLSNLNTLLKSITAPSLLILDYAKEFTK